MREARRNNAAGPIKLDTVSAAIKNPHTGIRPKENFSAFRIVYGSPSRFAGRERNESDD